MHGKMFWIKLIFAALVASAVLIVGAALAEAAPAGQCELAWDQVTTSTDGSPADGLLGYRLYSAKISGGYEEGSPTLEVRLDALDDVKNPRVTTACEDGQFWVATSFDAAGESGYSNEIQIDLMPPAPPEGFRLIEVTTLTETLEETKTQTLQRILTKPAAP